MIAMSFGVALVIAAANPTMESYPASGPYLAWLLGLPSWLMGCKLAEHIRENPREAADPSIWLWRFGVFVLGLACNVAKSYSPVGYPWTLNLFALFASVWLLKELHHFQRYRPSGYLEWAGSWSYSLYLFHTLAMAMIPLLPTIDAGTRTNWAYHLLFVFCSSLLFAHLFEFPSHTLARSTSRWVRTTAWRFAARA